MTEHSQSYELALTSYLGLTNESVLIGESKELPITILEIEELIKENICTHDRFRNNYDLLRYKELNKFKCQYRQLNKYLKYGELTEDFVIKLDSLTELFALTEVGMIKYISCRDSSIIELRKFCMLINTYIDEVIILIDLMLAHANSIVSI